MFVLTINRMLASSVFKQTKGTGSASNKALKTTPFGRSDAITRGGFAIMPHATAPLSLMLYAMEKLELMPLLGFGQIKLGVQRSDIHKLLGSPNDFNENTDYYSESSIQIHYSDNTVVDYIEIASDQNVVWDGISIFSTPVVDLVKELSEKTKQSTNESEPGYTFTYPEYELSFWRPLQPDEEEPDEGKYFESVGLGCKGYFSSGI
ncbi:hypothetical protein [Alteromonas stellipolaris]|uniref:hypothetical protein n=1 Tax=Alteromonas stellipolaris TaxID=233316 RepID=UPI0027370FB4|nr:hypothetical protein [Alteromonas stellipolaris]MDP2538122.1 hypothetical protein [Alteromonas stellipolaris]